MDPDGDRLAVVLPLVSNPAHGELSITADGALRYRPAPDFAGTDRFSYLATDGVAASNEATVRITVTPANRPPVAADDQYQALAGQTLVVGQPDNAGTIELVAAGSVWRYLDDGSDQGTAWRGPNFDDSAWASGPAQFGYGDGDEATVVSFGPNANMKYTTTYFRRKFTIPDPSEITSMLLNVVRDDGVVVYINGVEVARSGLPAGNISYNTPANMTAGGASETTRVPFNVTATQLAALNLVAGENTIAAEIHQDANGSSSDISFDLQLAGMIFVVPPPAGVLANDSDADGDSLSAELVTPPSHGTLQFAANGSFTYTPAADFTGQDNFTYRASDGAAVSDVATVIIEVRDPQENRAPVANPDAYSTPAGQVLRVGGPSDPNTTRALIARGATWRYLDNGTDQGTAWRQLDYSDQSWATGPAELGYGDGDEATVVSFGPDAVNKYITTYFRRHLQIDDPSTLSGVQLGIVFDDGIVVYVNGQEAVRRNLPAGDIQFNMLASAAIEDTFIFEPVAIDASLLRSGDNVVAVEIHQNHTTSSDISFDLELVAMSSEQLPAGVLANDTDADGDALTAILVSPPQQGTLQLASDGSFVYSPSAGFVGEDSFTYRATDGLAASNVAAVTITVGEPPANSPPIAVNDNYTVDQGQVLVVGGADVGTAGVLNNDSDADDDPLTAVLVNPPQHGTLEFRPNGSFTYDNDNDFVGVDTFTYQADDGAARSNTATVTIEIRPIAPPVLEIFVSTTVDEVDGDHSQGDLSLREAILLSNQSAAEARIIVPAGTFRLDLGGADEDAAATGDLDILRANAELKIVGAGPDQTIIDGAGLDRVFDVLADDYFFTGLVLESLTLRGGVASGGDGFSGGGAIRARDHLTLRNVHVVENRAMDDAGGGIWADYGLIIEDSRIANNEANECGGGVRASSEPLPARIVRSRIDGNRSGTWGGGICAGNSLTVRDSTISQNRASEAGGGLALWNGHHSIVNSTISGNYAEFGGGGIFNNDDVVQSDFDNLTIVDNRVGADGVGGGIDTEEGPQLRNSIVARNIRETTPATPDDLNGFFDATSRYNLIGVIDGSTGLGDVTSHNRFGSLASGRLDPRLGPLLDNGGPTKTHAILPGSVALDGGDPNFDTDIVDPPLQFDQRSRWRVADVSCGPDALCGPIQIIDIGAFELQPTDPAPERGDFNGDREINAADIDMLMAVVRREGAAAGAQVVPAAPLASETLIYDLTGDAVVDHADADYLIETVLETAYGDVDLDGRVGLRDLVLLRNGLGQSLTGWAGGDVDGDGGVDVADLALLSANFGYRRGVVSVPAAPSAIVESHPGAPAWERGALGAGRRSPAPRAVDAALLLSDSVERPATTRLTATRRRPAAPSLV
jgi:hypothetical protein